MKTAIYIRVSTRSQEGKNQELALREYCEKQGYEIIRVYSDIMSGKETSRPAFDLLFKHARERRFDLVLFWSIDRFSRAGTLFTLQKLRELEALKIGWESFTETYFNSIGDFKDVVLSIMSTLAKIEREKISERTKAGLRASPNRHKIGKRGKDKKPRKIRNDRGMRRNFYKNKYFEIGNKKEHRVIMEKHIGRELKAEEIVHHIDENKRNNRIENLQLLKNKAEHNKIHSIKRGSKNKSKITKEINPQTT